MFNAYDVSLLYQQSQGVLERCNKQAFYKKYFTEL